MSSEDMSEIQRSLGNLEGTTKQILARLDDIQKTQEKHEGDDRNNFQVMSSRVANESVKTNEHLYDQDKIIADLTANQNKAKGAGWVILGLLGTFALSMGMAFLGVLSGHIKWHW